ncbi:hypothetical protein [Actinophytocola sp.]|uniref:hypothetical protein n=1 Tax=Actinophytocola sp. TaxID=1872138 RepID=UPI002ED41C00
MSDKTSATTPQQQQEDLREQAIHVLRTSTIHWSYGRYNPLSESGAERAVAALANAGLLGGTVKDLAEQHGPLTVEDAQGRLDARRLEPAYDITLAATGTLRLRRCTAAQCFIASDHRSELYRGDDLADAVHAYNEALADRAG